MATRKCKDLCSNGAHSDLILVNLFIWFSFVFLCSWLSPFDFCWSHICSRLFISRCWKLQQCFRPNWKRVQVQVYFRINLFDLICRQRKRKSNSINRSCHWMGKWQSDTWLTVCVTVVGARMEHGFSPSFKLRESNQCKSQWRQLLYNKLASLSLNDCPHCYCWQGGQHDNSPRVLFSGRGHTHTNPAHSLTHLLFAENFWTSFCLNETYFKLRLSFSISTLKKNTLYWFTTTVHYSSLSSQFLSTFLPLFCCWRFELSNNSNTRERDWVCVLAHLVVYRSQTTCAFLCQQKKDFVRTHL